MSHLNQKGFYFIKLVNDLLEMLHAVGIQNPNEGYNDISNSRKIKLFAGNFFVYDFETTIVVNLLLIDNVDIYF